MRPPPSFFVLAVLAAAATGATAQSRGSLRPAQLGDGMVVPLAIEQPIKNQLPASLVPGKHLIKIEGDALRIDSNGDGELDRHVLSRGSTVLVQRAGDLRPRTLVVYRKLETWFAAPASLIKGSVAGQQMELLDADSDGRFDGPEDYLRFDRGSFLKHSQARLVTGRKGPWRYVVTRKGREWLAELTKVERPGEFKPLSWAALNHLNRWRNGVGLAPLQLSRSLSHGCQKHADYLHRHAAEFEENPGKDGLAVHDEDPKKAGYSKEGQEAARWSNIVQVADPVKAIDLQTPTMLHRVWFLTNPQSGLGIGISGDPKAKKPVGWSVIRTGRKLVNSVRAIVVVPAPGQRKVPLLAMPEYPIPEIDPACYLRKPGYPVSVTFGALKLTDIKLQLFRGLDGKIPVKGYLFTPKQPIHKSLPNNSLSAFFLPRHALRKNRTYVAVFTAKIRDNPVRLVWSFKT